MSVELMPSNQLGFNRPLTNLVKKTIHIHNPHPHPIAFKVKTTAPKQYCVRPNSGRVEVGETVEVLVLLQPLPQDPPPHAKCKDKFLVQSAFITPDEEMRSLSEMWANVEKADKSAIHEQKLKCVYLPAEDGGVSGIPEETEEHAGDKSKIDESQIFAPAEEASSPIHANGKSLTPEKTSTPPSNPIVAATAAAKPETKEIPSLTTSDLAKANVVSPTNVALEKSVNLTHNLESSTATQSTETDAEKLAKALKEIERLRAELDEKNGPSVTGLRKRGGVTVGSNGTETAVEKVKEVIQQSNGGVPLEIVAGLVVGVFVLTYLFF